MKPVDMQVFEAGKGDCLRACIASILELRPDEVPNFTEIKGPQARVVTQWLSTRGLALLEVPVASMDFYFVFEYAKIWHIISGRGPRGLRHATVGLSGKIVHDPHPSRAGLIGEPETYEFFIPADPAKMDISSEVKP